MANNCILYVINLTFYQYLISEMVQLTDGLIF